MKFISHLLLVLYTLLHIIYILISDTSRAGQGSNYFRDLSKKGLNAQSANEVKLIFIHTENGSFTSKS